MSDTTFKPIPDSPSTVLSITNTVDTLFTQVIYTLPTEGITAENVAQIVLQLMQLVEQVPSLSGPQKKLIVSRVVNKLLQHFNTPPQVQTLISVAVPPLIDAFIQVDKKQVVISIEKGIGRFFSCVKNGCKCA